MLELSNPYTNKEYAVNFRITEDQRIRAQHRISSGEKQEMYKKKTMTGPGFNIGVLGETVFEDLFPEALSIKEVLTPEINDKHKVIQFYTDYFLNTPERSLHIDVKARQFKSKQYKHPASFFNIYITNDIRKNVEKGFYKTDYYAFVGIHENQEQGYWFALIPPQVFFEHAEYKKQWRDGANLISDSWCLPVDVAYELSEHEKLGFDLNFSFERKNDEESFWLLSKGTPVTVKIFHDEKLHGFREVNLKEDQTFKSKDTYLEHVGDGKYRVLFHTNPKEPEKVNYHLIVDRNDLTFQSAI